MVGLKKFLYTITQKLSSRQNTRIRKIKKREKRDRIRRGQTSKRERERKREDCMKLE